MRQRKSDFVSRSCTRRSCSDSWTVEKADRYTETTTQTRTASYLDCRERVPAMSRALEDAAQLLVTASEQDLELTLSQVDPADRARLLHSLLAVSLPKPATTQAGSGSQAGPSHSHKTATRQPARPDTATCPGRQPVEVVVEGLVAVEPWQLVVLQPDRQPDRQCRRNSKTGLVYVDHRTRTGGRGRWSDSQKTYFCVVACLQCQKEPCNKRMESEIDGHWPHFCRGCKPHGAPVPSWVAP